MKSKNNCEFEFKDEYISLGCAISYYRKLKGLTQQQLADSINISRQHLGAIEAPNMFRKVSLNLLFSIAKVLEIDLCSLLTFSPEK